MFEPKTLMDEVIEVSSSGEIAVLFISEECKYYKKNLKKIALLQHNQLVTIFMILLIDN